MRNFFKFKILFIALFLSYSGYSQSVLDSLKSRLPKTNGEEKARTLNLLSKEIVSSDKEAGLDYANQAYKLSLKIKFRKGEADALHNIATYYRKTNKNDKALENYNKSLKIRLEIQDTTEIARSYNNIGEVYYNLSKYEEAIKNYEEARKIKKLLGDKKGEGISLNNMANAYTSLGKYKDAIKMYQASLKIFEEIGLTAGISSSLNGIGLIYQNMSNTTDTINKNKALEYFLKALEINQKENNKAEIGTASNNIGNLYSYYSAYFEKMLEDSLGTADKKFLKKKFDEYLEKSLKYYEISLKNREEINDLPGIASSLTNIGGVYVEKNEFNKAQKYFAKSLEISKQINNLYETSINYYNLGQCFLQLKQYSEALKYSNQSLKISYDIDNKRLILSTYKQLSSIYEGMGSFQKALETFKVFQQVNDSLINVESGKFIEELQTKYDTEKKDAQLKLKDATIEKEKIEKEKADEKARAQTVMLIIAFIGLGIVLILIVFVYRSYRQKKQANVQLAEQNELITHQKQEIMDSIHYAKRIQTAILPPGDYVQGILPHRFILFKPRDIVSGDFYWVKYIEKSDVIVATAADCTGHGVPGAFMSMLGVAFLNEIVNRTDINHPGQVLNHLRQNVITSLHQTGKFGEAQDGMDIALIAYFPKKKRVEFAGANNPLYIIRKRNELIVNGQLEPPNLEHAGLFLFELKGDKMPIGIHTRVNEPFTNYEIDLEEDDRIYIFSDGYPDQFGGKEAKKFKYKPFKQLLMETYDKTMDEQKEIIDAKIIEWQGPLDQVDDIIVMGIKVTS